MRFGLRSTFLCFLAAPAFVAGLPAAHASLHDAVTANQTVSARLYADLEELSRIVDVAYCVGLTGLGVSKPFQCASRCQDFENFELVNTWNTGPFLSDSCGYIALSHPPSPPRIIVAFRGTYSIANTVADLSTIPQEYTPYPGDGDDDAEDDISAHIISSTLDDAKPPRCVDCSIHSGFHTSWLHTRSVILSDLSAAIAAYPNYSLTLVGHSLGGAVACLASLDFLARGWDPHITTFGEPMVGNEALASYINARFNLSESSAPNATENPRYRRVTHTADPVPLLPPSEWGYRPHAGELFIAKSDLSPVPSDILLCAGNEDPSCIAGAESSTDAVAFIAETARRLTKIQVQDADPMAQKWEPSSLVPDRFKLWQLFSAHRDYFWRLGLCVPGGDGWKWATGLVRGEREDL